MKKLENLKLSNTFAKLGADFLQEKSPDPVSNPYLIDSNPTAIKLIGLELSEIKKINSSNTFLGTVFYQIQNHWLWPTRVINLDHTTQDLATEEGYCWVKFKIKTIILWIYI